MSADVLSVVSCCCCVFRSFRPSQPDKPARRQRDRGRGRPRDGPSQLDPARGARHPHTSLQSVLELDRAHQVHGAIQEEKEKDHQRGNLLLGLSQWRLLSPSPLFPLSKSCPGLSQHLPLWLRHVTVNIHVVEKKDKHGIEVAFIYIHLRGYQSHTDWYNVFFTVIIPDTDERTLKRTVNLWKKTH